ncbi:MAG TPA: type II toxin-antitoxin system RelE/ParE family toxin [Bacteroidota bacterium]
MQNTACRLCASEGMCAVLWFNGRPPVAPTRHYFGSVASVSLSRSPRYALSRFSLPALPVALTGALKGFWSITVTGNYRIIFRLVNETVYDVDYIDYH